MESVALYSFQATEKDELPFQKGDTLKVQGTGVTSRGQGGLDAVALWGQIGHMVAPVLSLSLPLMLLGLPVGYKETASRILEGGITFPACPCHQAQLQRRTAPAGTWRVASLAVSATSCAL